MTLSRKKQLQEAQKKARLKKKKNNKKQVSFYLEEELLNKLKVICDANQLSYSDFIEKAVINEQLHAPIQLEFLHKTMSLDNTKLKTHRKLCRVFGLELDSTGDTLEKKVLRYFLGKEVWLKLYRITSSNFKDKYNAPCSIKEIADIIVDNFDDDGE